MRSVVGVQLPEWLFLSFSLLGFLRLTTGMAIVFMITSLTLGVFSREGPSTSVFDDVTPAAERPTREQVSPEGQEQSGSSEKPPVSTLPPTP